ncbi:protein spindle-F [Anthonomus grandis grandis]|uniref:protein spindle-F n=1 Tax=Anthonomus grandis grandis TaxID=2921223 RepID=UPI0021653F37|nr:protein spindle-F [Anthonomus grandis grandis]
MDDGQGSQYAIQIAVHTLRDRCKNLQQRVALLEEENVNLRIQCSKNDDAKDSLNELDRLRAQVAELSEQKEQLHNKVKMVTNENQDLWGKLSKLTRVNKSLGSQLSKINDTLTQHSSPATSPTTQTNLIRSKTFTKSEVQTKLLQKNLEENDKISLELVDISLKLSDCFSKQRKELDALCSEISEITFSNCELTTDNCGFLFDEELQDDTFVDIHAFQEDLATLKDALLYQQTVLELNVKNMLNIKDKVQCKRCLSKGTKIEKCTSTSDLNKKTFDSKSTETERSNNTSPNQRQNHAEPPPTNDRICPLCSKEFRKEIDFVIFQRHVEEHFVPDVEAYELL